MRGTPGLLCFPGESPWLSLDPVLTASLILHDLTFVTAAVTKWRPQQLPRGRVSSWLMAWEGTVHHGREGTVEERRHAARAWGSWLHYITSRSREHCRGNQVYTLSHKACLLPVTYFLLFPEGSTISQCTGISGGPCAQTQEPNWSH